MLWITACLVPFLVIAAWLFTASIAKTRFPTLLNKKICLLIAHPDDEAMFFAPTVLSLTAPRLGNHVKILCLSSGNADGLGETRIKELRKSSVLLGLRTEDDVFVVESPDFQDSMTSAWPKEKIMDLLSSAFAPQLARSPRPHLTEPPTPTIDVLITFDAHGISSHPNHISLYYGARHFISSLTGNNPGWQCPVNLYILTSTNIVRKYSSFLDALISMGLVFFQRKSKGNHPSSLFFISGPKELRTAQQAMTNAHVSQMKWFRWGWIWLSRYMVVNDLKLDKVS